MFDPHVVADNSAQEARDAADELAHKAELAAQFNKAANRQGVVVAVWRNAPPVFIGRVEPHITF